MAGAITTIRTNLLPTALTECHQGIKKCVSRELRVGGVIRGCLVVVEGLC